MDCTQVIRTVIVGYCFLFPGLFLLFVSNEIARIFIALIWKIFYLFRSNYSCKLISNGLQGIQLAFGTNWTCIFLLELDSPQQNQEDILLNHIKAILEEQLIEQEKYSKLKECINIKWGYPIWESLPDFSVHNHVRYWNGEEVIGTGQLCMKDVVETLVPYLIRNKMSLTTKDIPLWEFIIIPNVLKEDGNKFQTVILFRFHHIYMDAASASLFLAEAVFNWGNKAGIEDNLRNETNTVVKEPSVRPPFVLDLYKKPGAFIRIHQLLSILRLPYFMAKDASSIKDTDSDPFFSRVGYSTEYFGMHRISSTIPVHLIQSLRCIKGTNKKLTTTQIFLKAVLRALKLIISEKSGTDSVVEKSTQIFFGIPLATLPYSAGSLSCKVFVSEKTFMLESEELSKDYPNPPSPNAAYSIKFFLGGLGRLPAALQKKMLMSMGGTKLRYSVSFSHVPFTTGKGSIGGHTVSSYGGWGAVWNPVGILINSLRYGDGYKLYIAGNSNSLSAQELDRFTKQVPLEIQNMYETQCLK